MDAMTMYRTTMGSFLALCVLASGGCKDDEGSGGSGSCGPAAANVAECFGGLVPEDEARQSCEEQFSMASADGAACEDAIAAENQCIANADCGGLLSGACDDQAQAVDDACPSVDRDSGGDGECPFTEDGECDEPEGTDICDEGTDVVDCS